MAAECALNALDIRVAKRIYQEVLADAGMVMSLERLEAIDDRNELLGHVAAIFSDFDLAQVQFI
jgi:hypothetical protein